MTSYLHLHQREGLIPLIVLKTRFLGLGALGFPYTLFCGPGAVYVSRAISSISSVSNWPIILRNCCRADDETGAVHSRAMCPGFPQL